MRSEIMQKSVYLNFTNELVNRPIISTLIRKYDIDVNILEARINPNEEGSMFVQVSGTDENVEQALGFLVSMGVRARVKPDRILWRQEICVSCGACVAQCLPRALSVDPASHLVLYDQEKCIACRLCIPACPYGAVEETAF
jgi:ferredoxin